MLGFLAAAVCSVLFGGTFAAVFYYLLSKSKQSTGRVTIEHSIPAVDSRTTAEVSPPDIGKTRELDQAREVLDELQKLAAQLTSNVGAHSSRMDSIQAEMHEAIANDQSVAPAQLVNVVQHIISANGELKKQLADARSQLDQQSQQIERHVLESLRDALTGIPNRRAFDRELDRRLAQFRQRLTPVSLVLVDVDHFKKFNDTHGHQAGDEVLKAVGDAIRNAVRDTDLAARYGGEEFAAVLPETGREAAVRVGERVRQAIAERLVRYGESQLKVTASVGVATIRAGESAEPFIARADTALYAAKSAGRNNVQFHDGQECVRFTESHRPAPAPEPAPQTTFKPQQESPLLNLPTRTEFSQELRRHLVESKRLFRPLAMMVVEVDEFKQVARTAPQTAESALAQVAARLKELSRQSDVVARYGEGQLSVLLPNTNLSGALESAYRLRVAVESAESLTHRGSVWKIQVRVGLAEGEERDTPVSMALRAEASLQADAAATVA